MFAKQKLKAGEIANVICAGLHLAIPMVRYSEGPPFRNFARSALLTVRHSEGPQMEFLDPLFSVIPESIPNILYIKLKLRISSK